jgi:hypothetical protein
VNASMEGSAQKNAASLLARRISFRLPQAGRLN